MRKIREVLRLKFGCGLSVRKIAHSSAGNYLCRREWPSLTHDVVRCSGTPSVSSGPSGAQ